MRVQRNSVTVDNRNEEVQSDQDYVKLVCFDKGNTKNIPELPMTREYSSTSEAAHVSNATLLRSSILLDLGGKLK